ncbi:N-formylglutamate amidohydrolase [Neoroseomonas soli]|uniref:N-formylglutamate amidohydrolase n=1 Tax=Neoroseomonas soli TaxID=1081025 RepID=A0A9X9WR67_9PROT|nr:N-formylglutamate amidohydrolase [Neoroseomonas soli]MBR0669646.1 N-formylglutamate amidohydrolase [Neoroseomonas soli]
MLMHVRPGVFLRRDPVADAAPVVFDIPRSGAEYPRAFRATAPMADVQRSISMYVEEVYGNVPDAGATWLYACFPNVFIDANRHELDIDPEAIEGEWPAALQPGAKTKMGIGLIPMVCAGTTRLYSGKLPVAEVRARLDDYYWPYHNELARLLNAQRERHGIALHMSCHSMPAIAAAGQADAGQRRSDFDLGDRNGTTCGAEVVDLVGSVLRGFGYNVTNNKHFIGAECVRKHGNPQNGIHSLQIEMNRSLYMDEAARTRRPELETVRAHLTELARQLAAYACSRSAA